MTRTRRRPRMPQRPARAARVTVPTPRRAMARAAAKRPARPRSRHAAARCRARPRAAPRARPRPARLSPARRSRTEGDSVARARQLQLLDPPAQVLIEPFEVDAFERLVDGLREDLLDGLLVLEVDHAHAGD